MGLSPLDLAVSFWAKHCVILSKALCHSEQSEESPCTRAHVILSKAKNLRASRAPSLRSG